MSIMESDDRFRHLFDRYLYVKIAVKKINKILFN